MSTTDHGGRRAGAGRPPGSRWKPAVIEMRAASAERKAAIIDSDRDPLLFLVETVFDETIDYSTRLAAAAIAVPYLHPRLSATQVQANHTVTRIDAGQLLERIAARIERLASPAAIDVAAEPVEVAGMPRT